MARFAATDAVTVIPEWYERGIGAPSEVAEIDVQGTPIHFEAWGERGLPGIVLVHGSNAHIEWWRWVAPFLADQFRVVALDSSGNGDSGWRQRYTAEVLAEEVMAVAEAAALGERPVIVGHSFGGWVVLQTAYRYGDALGGVVFLDFTVAPREQYLEWGMRAEREGVEPGRRLRVYGDLESAVTRFRYIPEQPDRVPGMREYIARKSLRRVDGGWTWKFDPTLFDHLEMGADQADRFAALRCRSAVVLGERSEDEGALYGDHMREIAPPGLPVFRIPGAHHHMMFEEPIAVVSAIKGIVLTWHQADLAVPS